MFEGLSLKELEAEIKKELKGNQVKKRGF